VFPSGPVTCSLDVAASEAILQPIPEHTQRQQRRAQRRAAGEGRVRHAGEQIEAAALAPGDGFGEQPAGQMGGVQAVAGISLGVVDVGLSGSRPICGRRLAPMPIMPPHWYSMPMPTSCGNTASIFGCM